MTKGEWTFVIIAVVLLFLIFCGCAVPHQRQDGLERLEAVACCDCGLVHQIKNRVVDGVVLSKWVRDDKLTKEWRTKTLPQNVNGVLVRQLDGGFIVFGIPFKDMIRMIENEKACQTTSPLPDIH